MTTIHNLNVYIDSEWGSDNKFLCFQALIVGGRLGYQKYIVFNREYQDFLAERGYLEGCVLKDRFNLSFSDFSDSEDRLTELLSQHLQLDLPTKGDLKVNCNLHMFFSPKDIWAGIGWDQFREIAFETTNEGHWILNQKRNLSGRFTCQIPEKISVTYKICDISGWTNFGLERLANSVGIETSDKKLFDEYKTCMEVGFKKHPEEFIRYSLFDVEVL